MSQNPKGRVWSGNTRIANEEEIQDSIFRGKGDANRFLGLKRAYTGRLPGKGVYDQQCKLQ
jgi:hypothetical protein